VLQAQTIDHPIWRTAQVTSGNLLSLDSTKPKGFTTKFRLLLYERGIACINPPMYEAHLRKYLKIHLLPQRKHHTSPLQKINQLTLFKEIIAVYCENY
jgi:hypothetical protein